MAFSLPRLLGNISGLQKLLFCTLLAAVSYGLFAMLRIDWQSRLILSWDVFCMLMLAHCWLLFFNTGASDTEALVKRQDDGVEVMFLLVLTGICFSLFGSLILMGVKSEYSFNKIFHAVVSFSPVVLSWLLLHTVFAIRYAHLYHDTDRRPTGNEIGGLDFPGNAKPDYLDFAYFSFVIGMTFQVSDVEISSRLIRRFVLLHSLIAFVFNTVIVALTISTLAGLIN